VITIVIVVDTSYVNLRSPGLVPWLPSPRTRGISIMRVKPGFFQTEDARLASSMQFAQQKKKR
jgi:hypothetical protein